MNDENSFDDELAAVATQVDEEVGNVVHFLRTGGSAGTKSTPAAEARATAVDPVPQTQGPPDPAEPSGPQNSQRGIRISRAKPVVAARPPRENVTTRLPSDTNLRLTEAALRQKLKKHKPDSRQEIIDEALQDWLAKHGYRK
jgi:hypothetical protein